jgi:hypothetical protein
MTDTVASDVSGENDGHSVQTLVRMLMDEREARIREEYKAHERYCEGFRSARRGVDAGLERVAKLLQKESLKSAGMFVGVLKSLRHEIEVNQLTKHDRERIIEAARAITDDATAITRCEPEEAEVSDSTPL